MKCKSRAPINSFTKSNGLTAHTHTKSVGERFGFRSDGNGETGILHTRQTDENDLILADQMASIIVTIAILVQVKCVEVTWRQSAIRAAASQKDFFCFWISFMFSMRDWIIENEFTMSSAVSAKKVRSQTGEFSRALWLLTAIKTHVAFTFEIQWSNGRCRCSRFNLFFSTNNNSQFTNIYSMRHETAAGRQIFGVKQLNRCVHICPKTIQTRDPHCESNVKYVCELVHANREQTKRNAIDGIHWTLHRMRSTRM